MESFVFLFVCATIMTSTQVKAEKTKLRVGALMSIFNDPNDLSASNLNIESVKNLEAILWVFRQLNDINYIDGFEIELDIAFTGNSPEVANLKIGELLHQNTDCQKSEPMIAMLGPETLDEAISTSTMLSSLPEEQRIPQVLFSTPSSILTDKTKYRNLLGVIESDESQTKAMIKVLEKLEWNMLAIVYENTLSGNNRASLFKERVKDIDICIVAEYVLESSKKPNFTNIVHDVHMQNINGIVFLGREMYMKEFLQAIEQFSELQASVNNIPAILLSDTSVTSDAVFKQNDVVMTSGKGAIFISFPLNHLSAFQNHWISLFENYTLLKNMSTSNPYLEMVYSSLQNCTKSPQNCTSRSLEMINKWTLYSPYAIHAAFVVGKALRVACSQPPNGIKLNASKLRDLLFNLDIDYSEIKQFGIELIEWDGKTINFQNGELLSNEYVVKNYRTCFKAATDKEFCGEKIGRFVTNPTEDVLYLDQKLFRDFVNGSEVEWNNRRIATCPVGFTCKNCLPKSLPSRTIYIPGDFIVLAAMPIHNIGTNPFNCGDIRKKAGFDLALATQWIIQSINNNRLYFGKYGKTIGMLIFDTCNDPLIIQEKILEFYKNGMRIGGDDLTGKVLGFVGSVGSGPTLAAANVIAKLNGVHVGYASVSSVLGNKNLYPSFLRVSMPLNKAAELMIEIAQALDANSIQVLYSEGEFGENGRDLTLDMSRKNRICVANNISVPEKPTDDYRGVLDLLQLNPKSRLVFVFVRSHVAKVISKSLNRNPKFKKGQFTFLTSDAWGNRYENIQYNEKLEGTISIAQEMKMKWDDMRSYLTKIYPKSHERRNAFLLPYFEVVFNCYFPWSFNKTYPEKCSTMKHSFSNDIQLDGWIPYVVWAVQALIKGANLAYEQLCGGKGRKLCEEYRLNPKRVREIIQTVKLDVNFDDVEDKLFDDNGDGVSGYKIYIAANSSGDTLEYVEIGEKRFGEKLDLPQVQKMKSQMAFHLVDLDVYTCLDIHCSVNEANSSDVKTSLYTVSALLALLVLVNVILLVFCIHKRRGKKHSSPHYLDTFHIPYSTRGSNKNTAAATNDVIEQE